MFNISNIFKKNKSNLKKNNFEFNLKENVFFKEEDITNHTMLFGSTGKGKSFDFQEEINKAKKAKIKKNLDNF